MVQAHQPAERASTGGRAVVIGDVMTDIVVRPEGELVRGSDRRATIRILPGGSGANQACWLAAFGIDATLLARVGASDRESLRASFAEAGVRALLGADPARPSGVLVSLVAPDGERSFLTDRGANDALNASDLPRALLSDAQLLHVSGYALVTPGPRAAVIDYMAEARRRGIEVSVDPGSAAFLREIGPDNFLRWTAAASICFPNQDEAAVLAGSADDGVQLRALAGFYPLVVVKRGHRGAAAADADGGCWNVPAPSVAVLDTTGAGDAFLAGFLAARCAGRAVEACLAAGVAAGSSVTTVLGARPGRHIFRFAPEQDVRTEPETATPPPGHAGAASPG